ncbi:MAG: hypothetical protein QNL88_11530 [Acidobacteriota bacterium]|nr:hypothetical protein [Acidobacteriota bacterium]
MTHRRHLPLSFMLLALFAVAASSPAVAEEPVTLGDAVTRGKLSLNLRYRYEGVDQTGFEENGQASTLRTALGYRTLWWHRLAAMIEFENVVNIGFSNDHNNAGAGSLWNGVTDRPVIPDPPLTEINQVYLDWKPLDTLPIRGGRQEIVIDNSRFVGNVGFRQNHQAFDGAKAHFTGVKNLDIGYAYIARQRTVTAASRPMSTSHLEGVYSFSGIGSLRGYLLSIDYDQEGLWRLSTATFGVSFAGKTSLSKPLGLTYRLELATQSDTGDNPETVEADYFRADLGFVFGKMKAAAGYEVLGGSPGDGSFNTPLATLHKFNGWADKFLVTPADGLRDVFVSLDANLGAFALTGVYHDFSADSGGASWGSEFDANVVYTAPWKQKFALTYAAYDADDWATDTDKFWVWTQWGF